MLRSIMIPSFRLKILPTCDRWLRSSFCRKFSISRSILEAPWQLRPHHKFIFPRHFHARLLHASTGVFSVLARIAANIAITCSDTTWRYSKTKAWDRVSGDLELPIKMNRFGLAGSRCTSKTPRETSSRPSKPMKEMTYWV